MKPPPMQSEECFYCGKPGYIAHDCRKKKTEKENHDIRDGGKYFECAEVGYIAKNYPKKNDKDESGEVQVNTDIVSIAQTALVKTASS